MAMDFRLPTSASGRVLLAVCVVIAGLGMGLGGWGWQSDEQRLVEMVGGYPGPTGAQSGFYDHMLPADLASPCAGLETADDHAPGIPGAETISTRCNWGRDLMISELSYQGIVWGYTLATDDNAIVIVDTDADGTLDRLYARLEPVPMPDWVATQADAGG